MREFDPTVLQTKVFTIILPDANVDVATTSHPNTSTARGNADSSNESVETMPVFYVHKGILASISPEFLKHIENEMREGLEGEMRLREVDMGTMQAFLKWAYLNEYSVPADWDLMTALLTHIKLYIFSDRFNISALKEQSFANVKATLVRPGTQSSDVHLRTAKLLVAAHYAIETLPSLKEPLVVYIIQYLGQVLPDLCELPEFLDLANSCPEAIVEICKASSKKSGVTGSGSTGDPDVLIRTCRGCGVTSVADLECRWGGCFHYWQPSPGSFTSYKEFPHIVSTSAPRWILAKCPGCERVDTSNALRCHSCGSGNLVQPGE
ncbi:hypothetical protein BDZ91DRAFT_785590 [Kalaharituber pfeilii]|nr:hypothetical protein BDZ91DRAFT_785590 [Kalaharituber pfeilii]